VPDAHRADPYRVPGFVPTPCRSLLHWVRAYAAGVAARAHVDFGDVMDEAVAAMLRSSLAFRQGTGSFAGFTKVVVRRGLHRYIVRHARAVARHGHHKPLDDVAMERALTVPSAEDQVIAADMLRAHWLREHAELARRAGDLAAVRRLLDAAAVAERTAHHPPRP
jgi:hypothetical protein